MSTPVNSDFWDKMPDVEKEQFAADWNAHYPIAELMEKYSISRDKVYWARNYLGLRKRGAKDYYRRPKTVNRSWDAWLEVHGEEFTKDWNGGMPWPLLSEKYKISKNHVAHVRDRLFLTGRTTTVSRPKPDPVLSDRYVRERRYCLTCGNKFDSEWAGNRRCSPCKNSAGWKSGTGEYEDG